MRYVSELISVRYKRNPYRETLNNDPYGLFYPTLFSWNMYEKKNKNICPEILAVIFLGVSLDLTTQSPSKLRLLHMPFWKILQ